MNFYRELLIRVVKYLTVLLILQQFEIKRNTSFYSLNVTFLLDRELLLYFSFFFGLPESIILKY